jgi:hypothetical protein
MEPGVSHLLTPLSTQHDAPRQSARGIVVGTGHLGNCGATQCGYAQTCTNPNGPLMQGGGGGP